MAERERLHSYARERLQAVAAAHGERVLDLPRNRVSIGVTLSTLPRDRVTFFGSQLFARNVSGARAINCAATNTIDGVEFSGWGASCDNYPTAYFTVAVAVGMEQDEIDRLCTKLDELFTKDAKQRRKRDAAPQPETE